MTGCVYIEIPGKNVMRRSVGYFVLTKCLWWALHQGVNPKTGEQHGARTPDPAAFKSWEDLLAAYLEQVKFFTTKMEQLERINLELYEKYCPRPFYSAVVEGCIESGKESRKWVYPSMLHHFMQVIGGTNVADSTLAPCPGRDKKGPTAVLNSCAKITAEETYNHLLNQKFMPKFLEDDLKPAFLGYLKTWKELNVPHIQFNVVDKKTLQAAQDYPGKYADMIVRVAGFSAYFVDLSRGLQDHIIARTEQSLA